MRIGQGFDIHRLVIDRPLVLGGVSIPFNKGTLGHSDGDVLLHAVCDALLGAAGLGDIGQHFPDTNPQFKDANSRFFVRHVLSLLTAQGYQLQNLDATLIAEAPKLWPFINAMRENLAHDLNIAIACINIKAKTMEKLGDIGQGEAIAAQVVVLLTQPSQAL